MASLKEIRERINSVSSTKKITSAMKMVSAAKLHKAEDSIARFLPYKNKLTEVLTQYTSSIDEQISSPLSAQRELKRVSIVCFSSNSGLCGTFNSNINKLLTALDGKKDRKARFRTVICLIEKDSTHYFEGSVDGQILTERHSNGEGFGYDPVFMPDRFAVSFAEMPLEVKNRISHRGLAVKKLCEFLNA